MIDVRVPISDAIEWDLDRGECLRWALIDHAEREMGLTNNDEGSISVLVEGEHFVCRYTPTY